MSAPTGNITAWADMKGGAVFAIRAPGPHGDVLAISYSNNEQLTNLISALQTITLQAIRGLSEANAQ